MNKHWAVTAQKATASALMPLVGLRCWWYGHEQHPQDSAPPESATCMHCGEYVPYGDMVGDARHNRVMGSLSYWLWRRWRPAKCPACGARYGHRGDCDGIPF